MFMDSPRRSEDSPKLTELPAGSTQLPVEVMKDRVDNLAQERIDKTNPAHENPPSLIGRAISVIVGILSLPLRGVLFLISGWKHLFGPPALGSVIDLDPLVRYKSDDPNEPGRLKMISKENLKTGDIVALPLGDGQICQVIKIVSISAEGFEYDDGTTIVASDDYAPDLYEIKGYSTKPYEVGYVMYWFGCDDFSEAEKDNLRKGDLVVLADKNIVVKIVGKDIPTEENSKIQYRIFDGKSDIYVDASDLKKIKK